MEQPLLDWFSRDLTQLVRPMAPGRTYTVLAPTGTGKTIFGLSVVAGILERYPDLRVMVVPTEESDRYYDLLACRAADLSYADYFYGRLAEADRERIALWADRYRETTNLCTVLKREPTLEEVLAAMGGQAPEVLLVDHVHCLEREGMRLPAFLDLTFSVLPEAAVQLKFVLILMAQIGRPHGRDPLHPYRIPTAQSGQGSAKIEQNSDVILTLSRKLQDDITKEDLARLARGLLRKGESVRQYEEPNTARVTCAKHRIDDEASRASVLLTVRGGKMQDRLYVVDGTSQLEIQDRGDAWEDGAPF